MRKAKTILQYLEVFATDNIRMSGAPNGDNKEIKAKNISLLVTPDQYNLLMLAEVKGQISLALRHRGDNSEVHPRDVDERSFERIGASRGKDDKNEDDSQAESEEKTKDVNETLDKEAKAASATKDGKPAKEEPAKPSWKLKVYEGDKLREEQVELPAEPDGTGKGPAKAGGRWQEFLKNFFRNAS
jgi:pilus assembly protein CpaB